MVVGSRCLKEGGSRDTFKNRFISKVFNWLALPLAPRVRDRASGFWCIQKNLIDIPIRDTVKPVLEYIVRGKLKSVIEIPYVFSPRKLGSTKHNRSTLVVKTFWDLLMLYLYKFKRPLKFLTVGGVGVGVNLGLLAFLTEVVHVWYIASAVVGILIATAWNYVMNNYWTFENKDLL